MKPEPERDITGENLRRALGACDGQVERSYEEFLRRLEGRGAAPHRRAPAGLLTLAASLFVCAGVLVAIFSSGGPRVEPAALPSQDKKVPPPEDAGLKAQIALLEKILDRTTDDKERELLQATLRTLQGQLAKSEKGKPVSKTDDRAAKLRAELDGVYAKIKMSKDADEKAALEMRAKELGQELKILDQGSRKEVPIKEVEAKLRENPDDVAALVDRARWSFENGKADPAIRDLDRAIQLKPDHAPALLLRGMAHALAGNLDAANKDVKRGAELDPAAKREIEYAWGTLKKLGQSQKEPSKSPKDVEQQIAALKDRLEELRAMEANAELPPNDRGRAKKEADRIQAEIEKLKVDLRPRPEKKP